MNIRRELSDMWHQSGPYNVGVDSQAIDLFLERTAAVIRSSVEAAADVIAERDYPNYEPDVNFARRVLTAACRFADLSHEGCQRHIYLGSIFGEPSPCECDCHKEADQ